MILIDSNILIDLDGMDATWLAWSERRLIACYPEHTPHINSIVFAEVSQRFANYDTAMDYVQRLGFPSLSLDDAAAYHAGQAYTIYRRHGGDRKVILADFFIGGHAKSLGCPILTRDPQRYQSYFPDLTLITPETHP